MLGILTKIFGTKSGRDLRALWPYVAQINAAYEALHDLSHDALREETQTLKEHIKRQLHPFEDAYLAAKKDVKANVSVDFEKSIQIDEQAEKLRHRYYQQLEEVLLESLPQAFAIVKETARRFQAHEQLIVTATAQDQILAEKASYVALKGNQAAWSNQWEVAGHQVVWNMLHYDVQLIGGIVLHQGKIAEMATGEGKTLVATLPAFLNALTGKGVHIVTVNDYLAKRDTAWMAPLYTFHGLTVDCINEHRAYSQGRQQAYQADIVYGTNNEFGFDYLRDNMTSRPEELVQRELHFAMVDEVDSVLVDDARTPLIISGPVTSSDEQAYNALNPTVQKLYEAQKALAAQLLQTAKKEIRAGHEQEGGMALFRTYRGLPKYKPLIKYLSEVGVKQILRKTENYYLQDNARMMPEADEPLLFTIDEQHNSIELTERGLEYLTQEAKDPHFFVLPDMGAEMANIEQDATLDVQEKLAQKEKLTKNYAIKSQRIHVLSQLLKAYALFEKDVAYVVVDKQVKIVDEQTGRILQGRRYADGLHQALEAKEHVQVGRASQTYATITLQNYFRMYHKLAGMTGTAATEAGEFWEIYGLDVVTIPTHHPIVRLDMDDKVYKTVREKFKAIIDEIILFTEKGRPVLVGTTSVEISELVSNMLSEKKIKHQVLNAKHHQKEAEIVAEAGKAGTVTIATNMAGRGTDIKLTPEAKAAGGLAIIGTERHESRRVDRQLRGRAGRQGDVGSSQFFVALEDSLMRLFGSERIVRIMDRMGLEEGEVIQHRMITRSIERAQQKVEQSNFMMRKRLLEYDNVMNAQREVVYERRKNALLGERLSLDTMEMMHATAEDLVQRYEGTSNHEGRRLAWLEVLGQTVDDDVYGQTTSPEEKIEKLYQTMLKHYEARKVYLQNEAWRVVKAIQQQTEGETPLRFSLPFSDGTTTLHVAASMAHCVTSQGATFVHHIERTAALYFIDQHWKEHLRAMDELKQAVNNAVYERQDPLVIYKVEGYNLFQQFMQRVNQATVTFLNHAAIQVAPQAETRTAHRVQLQESKQDVTSLVNTNTPSTRPATTKTLAPQKIAHRNQRVNVRYTDGSIKENVKFKLVEEDIAHGRCSVMKRVAE